jgi:hypothetical protein
LLRLRGFFLNNDDFAWAEHWHIGYSQRQGVSQDDVRRIPHGPEASGWSPFDAILLRAADELQGGRFIQDNTWQALAARYRAEQLLDLIFIAGHDAMIDMYLNSVAINLEPGWTAHEMLDTGHRPGVLASSNAARQVPAFARPRTPRIQPLNPASAWTDLQRQALGAWNRGQDTADWLKTCLRNLPLCRSWVPLIRYTATESTLASRERELLRLRTFFLGRCDFGWGEHVGIGYSRREGLTDDEIVRITKGPQAIGWNRSDAVLLQAADELHSKRFIEDATWKSLAERYNDQQLLDLIFIVGADTTMSMYLNSVGVPLEAGWKGVPD